VGAVAYRVVQEALTNVLRHAGPVPTEVTVAALESQLRIRVQDHGEPVRTSTADVPTSAGHGLRGMRERVLAQGGTLRAGANPTGGFTVTAELPLRAAAPGGES
jgi:signal transduction histidine kinase